MSDQATEISFAVAGVPPTKNEAKSLLAAGHPHASLVERLLRAAARATTDAGWNQATGDIALDLVVRGPTRPPSDATNYLGGIADVLQEKRGTPTLDMSHLGDLRAVALYLDDRQIAEISYREERADEPSYRVRVRRLDTVSPVNSPTHQAAAGPDEDATDRNRRVIAALVGKGTDLGFTVRQEYPVPGGRLDVVWLLPVLASLPGVDGPVPVVGFEVESSWRTRKHIKGDYLNLYDLGAAVGVLVLLGDGAEVEATRRFAQALVDRPGPSVVIWSERDVDRLLNPQPSTIASTDQPTAAPADNARPAAVRHVGKFRALWAWLAVQPGTELPLSFNEIEEIAGTPLPPSCRRHPAHWSSYEGSAVARAIQDAGWTATRVDLTRQRLVLLRRPRAGD